MRSEKPWKSDVIAKWQPLCILHTNCSLGTIPLTWSKNRLHLEDNLFIWNNLSSIGAPSSSLGGQLVHMEHNRLQMEDNPFRWNTPLIWSKSVFSWRTTRSDGTPRSYGAKASSVGGQPVQMEHPAHMEHNRLQMEDNPFVWNNPFIWSNPFTWNKIVFIWRTTRSIGTTRSLEHNRLLLEDNLSLLGAKQIYLPSYLI
ncbi:hypothetical protein CAEBREN_25126 [Caenorhabditis brenneri]|uniref:Uncharacterized protein n=1 Tax=Caenorhabditis brenneri TaxID=135651 RepID=G0MVL1_CAEBE|nr:hypothetical protein CAEBREN_25126 [Caenorhabditis brenneri]